MKFFPICDHRVSRKKREHLLSNSIFFFPKHEFPRLQQQTIINLFFFPPFWVPLDFLMKLGQRVAEADANIEAQGRYLAVLMCKNVTWKHSPTNRNECNDAIHGIIMELGWWWILIHTHIGLSKRGFPHSIHWFIINFLIRIAFLGYLTIGETAYLWCFLAGPRNYLQISRNCFPRTMFNFSRNCWWILRNYL